MISVTILINFIFTEEEKKCEIFAINFGHKKRTHNEKKIKRMPKQQCIHKPILLNMNLNNNSFFFSSWRGKIVGCYESKSTKWRELFDQQTHNSTHFCPQFIIVIKVAR